MKRASLHILFELSMVLALFLVSVCSTTAQISEGNSKTNSSDSTTQVSNPSMGTIAYGQPKDIEEYLNQISNTSIPRTVRKKWKEEALQLFANGAVQVLDEKEGLGSRYTATALLNLLVDFPHQVKVNEVLRDQQDKITELHLKMDRQTK